MKTDFNYPRKNLIGSVVSRPDSKNFETINTNQAWSLFFTVGQHDKGLVFTNLLIVIEVAGILWAIYFSQLGRSSLFIFSV